jgi:RNA polymerase sigma-54 factor
VRKHLDTLAARDYKTLLKDLGVDESELHEVIALIQTLNPRPGALISSAPAEYIIPDVFVRRRDNHWHVELNPEIAPRLRINPLYASFVRRADTSQDNLYMRNSLQEARWFIKSLQSRNETLLRVATAIVEHQRGFLEYGDEAMKPLVLRDIAEQLNMHESTISRVTTQKYMHTPRGIFEFKHFFSSHVTTADGGECSATAIRAMIRKLIAEEPDRKPMSDSKIAAILVDRGIHVRDARSPSTVSPWPFRPPTSAGSSSEDSFSSPTDHRMLKGVTHAHQPHRSSRGRHACPAQLCQ